MVLTLEQVRELLGLSAEELEKIIEEHKEELVPYLRQTVEPATLVKVRELKQVPEC
jgi:ribosomal protein L29